MARELGRAVRAGALTAVSLALFCIQVDFFALNLAIPGIAEELGVGATAAQWTLSAYMLAIGCFFIVGGRLGDVFGRRPVLLAGLALFAGASVGCAAAPGLGLLVAFRIVQGVGAALVFPTSVSVVSNTFPAHGRARALGAAFGIANLGTALGPFVGGGLTEGPGWRWIFWLLAPISGLALAVALVSVPDSRDESAPRRIDLPGCLAVVVCLAALTLAVERGADWGWTGARTLGLLAVSATAGALFVRRERRTAHPLVDLAIFRNVPFDLVTAVGSVCNMGYAVTVFLATLQLQEIRGLSALAAGTVFLAPALMVALTGPIGGRLATRLRPTAVMVLAAAVAGSGMVALSAVSALWLYVPVFAWCGLGLGLGWTFASVATQQVVPPARAGEASGVVLTCLVTLGAVALAGAAAAITALTPAHSDADAYTAVLRAGGLAILAAAAAGAAADRLLVARGVLAAAPPAPGRGGGGGR
ncbi:MFS transporter, partial [Kitasatospora sp. NPDC059571]|uniref:MFS transporter n=1 Tax=Kitasatospora sp. NPDC059571 TaxID=3346871 RepID=UPI003691B567